MPHTLRSEVLSDAFKALLKHHDALRLRFEKRDTGWVQSIAEWKDNDETLIKHSDLSSLPPQSQREALEKAASEIQATLNLEQGPILRVVRFHLGAGAADRLLIAIHHLAVDGVSWRILLEDLDTAYSQLEAGEPVKLPLKTTSYKAWSEHLQDYAQSETLLTELDYWRALGERQFIPLPQDKQCAPNENTLATTAICTVNLDEKTTEDLLHKVPDAYHAEINDILLTALLLACHQWTGEKTLLLDLEGQGRGQLFDDVDLSRTAGWFTTIFPVQLTLESATDLGASLKSIKEQLRQIPNKGIGYGLLRYCNKNSSVTQALEKLPAPQVGFNCLGQVDQITQKGNPFQSAKESAGISHRPQQTRMHVIDLYSGVINGCLAIDIHYSTAIHEEQTINNLSACLTRNLQALVEHCSSPDAGGYTPSDFPEAGLSQDQLEALFDELK